LTNAIFGLIKVRDGLQFTPSTHGESRNSRPKGTRGFRIFISLFSSPAHPQSRGPAEPPPRRRSRAPRRRPAQPTNSRAYGHPTTPFRRAQRVPPAQKRRQLEAGHGFLSLPFVRANEIPDHHLAKCGPPSFDPPPGCPAAGCLCFRRRLGLETARNGQPTAPTRPPTGWPCRRTHANALRGDLGTQDEPAYHGPTRPRLFYRRTGSWSWPKPITNRPADSGGAGTTAIQPSEDRVTYLLWTSATNGCLQSGSTNGPTSNRVVGPRAPAGRLQNAGAGPQGPRPPNPDLTLFRRPSPTRYPPSEAYSDVGNHASLFITPWPLPTGSLPLVYTPGLTPPRFLDPVLPRVDHEHVPFRKASTSSETG